MYQQDLHSLTGYLESELKQDYSDRENQNHVQILEWVKICGGRLRSLAANPEALRKALTEFRGDLHELTSERNILGGGYQPQSWNGKLKLDKGGIRRSGRLNGIIENVIKPLCDRLIRSVDQDLTSSSSMDQGDPFRQVDRALTSSSSMDQGDPLLSSLGMLQDTINRITPASEEDERARHQSLIDTVREMITSCEGVVREGAASTRLQNWLFIFQQLAAFRDALSKWTSPVTLNLSRSFKKSLESVKEALEAARRGVNSHIRNDMNQMVHEIPARGEAIDTIARAKETVERILGLPSEQQRSTKSKTQLSLAVGEVISIYKRLQEEQKRLQEEQTRERRARQEAYEQLQEEQTRERQARQKAEDRAVENAARLEAAEMARKAAEEQVSNISRELDEARQAARRTEEELKKRSEELERMDAELRKKLAEQELSLQQKREIEGRLNELSTEIEQLNAAASLNDILSTELDQKAAELSQKAAEEASLRKELARQERERERLSSQLRFFKQRSREREQERNQEAERKQAALRQKIETLQKSLEDERKRQQEAGAETSQNQARIEELENQQARIEELENQLAVHEAQEKAAAERESAERKFKKDVLREAQQRINDLDLDHEFRILDEDYKRYARETLLHVIRLALEAPGVISNAYDSYDRYVSSGEGGEFIGRLVNFFVDMGIRLLQPAINGHMNLLDAIQEFRGRLAELLKQLNENSRSLPGDLTPVKEAGVIEYNQLKTQSAELRGHLLQLLEALFPRKNSDLDPTNRYMPQALEAMKQAFFGVVNDLAEQRKKEYLNPTERKLLDPISAAIAQYQKQERSRPAEPAAIFVSRSRI
ncbi:MAG: hypothetical protein JW855_00860 [Gammaproteobacteria bacterium]|nr:hypothetical protein [Gammaproteobacteria bacterium]